jgi:hypothetical protein
MYPSGRAPAHADPLQLFLAVRSRSLWHHEYGVGYKDRVAKRFRQDTHKGAVSRRKNGALRPPRFYKRQERKQAQANTNTGQEDPDTEEGERIGKPRVQRPFGVSDQHDCGGGSKERPNARKPPTAHRCLSKLLHQVPILNVRSRGWQSGKERPVLADCGDEE